MGIHYLEKPVEEFFALDFRGADPLFADFVTLLFEADFVLETVLFAEDFVADFFAADEDVPLELPLSAELLFELLFVADFFVAVFEGADFLVADLDADFFSGTLAPLSLASERPIAIACLGLVTFFPLPLFKVPSCISCIALCTLSCDIFEYLAIEFIVRLVNTRC